MLLNDQPQYDTWHTSSQHACHGIGIRYWACIKPIDYTHHAIVYCFRQYAWGKKVNSFDHSVQKTTQM